MPDGHNVSEAEFVSVIRSKRKCGKCSYALESDQNELFLTDTQLYWKHSHLSCLAKETDIFPETLCRYTRHTVDMNNNSHVIHVLKEPTIFADLERNKHSLSTKLMCGRKFVVQVGPTGKSLRHVSRNFWFEPRPGHRIS